MFCPINPGFAQSVPPPDGVLLWRTPLYGVINQYLSVGIHESGHLLVGEALGYDAEYIHIGFFGGEVKFKNQDSMGTFQNTAMLLAGPLSNRITAAAINSYLNTNEGGMDENFRSFLGTAYLWNRGNFAYYLFRSFITGAVFGDMRNDWGLTVIRWTDGSITPACMIMGIFAAAELWDIWNSREEIECNYNRMLGRPTTSLSGVSGINGFTLEPYGAKGWVVNKQCQF